MNEKSQNPTTLNHEYGHLLQEEEYGTTEYFKKVAIPSITTNIIARFDEDIKSMYYFMPWEFGADHRAGIDRGNYAPGAEALWRLCYEWFN